MIKKFILAAALTLMTTSVFAQEPVCDTSTMPITSLEKIIADADIKAGVQSRIEIFDQGSTTAILDFVEKKLGRPVDRNEQIIFLSRKGFPSVMVLFMNKGCAKFSGSLTIKEAQELRDVARGV